MNVIFKTQIHNGNPIPTVGNRCDLIPHLTWSNFVEQLRWEMKKQANFPLQVPFFHC